MRTAEAALKSCLMAHGLLFEAGNSLEAVLVLTLVAVLQLILVSETACVRCCWCHDQFRWFGLDPLDLAEESLTYWKSEKRYL